MATVTAEIDMDEISTRELVSEIISRIGNGRRKRLNDYQTQQLKNALIPLNQKLGYSTAEFFPVSSLDDRSKLEHLERVWQKYTVTEIEKALPERI